MGDLSANFDRSELACKCGCGANHISLYLVAYLQMIRDAVGHPLAITSGVRCPRYNHQCGGKPDSAHTTGEAVDIYCNSSTLRHQLVSLAMRAGICRIGIHKQFVHLDISTKHAQDVVWVY